MHPSDRLKGTSSALLSGRRVVLGVSGSIAAVETVKIVHELKRHGADVHVVMTGAAQRFITPLALEFATGHPVVAQLSGLAEHVALCDGREGSGDVLVLAPATANTVAKVALGIDDTPVTSCATVALGAGVPVVVAPAMHDVMHGNRAVQARIQDLRALGVHFVEPVLAEEKAKLASATAILDATVRALATGRWVGRRAVVISGATAETVDPIRVVTNRSSGRMGVELARALHHRGATVELWNAWGLVALPEGIGARRFETVAELMKMVEAMDWKGVDAVFMPAALSDFRPIAAKQKLSSDAQSIAIEMEPLPKIIVEVRKRAKKAVLVAFKAESDAKILEARARDRLKRYGADLIVANTTQGFGGEKTDVLLVTADSKASKVVGLKTDVAHKIVDSAADFLVAPGA